MFLQQVDDFAVASTSKEIAQDVITTIDKFMTIQIKNLGQIARYNGVGVVQTKYYIKLNNPTYIQKIIQEHS